LIFLVEPLLFLQAVKTLIVDSIRLENFRNYKDIELNFCDGINIFQGLNGQGKTNLLESIYICSVGKSFRTSKDIEMINHEKEYFTVNVGIKNDATDKIFIRYDRQKQKAIAVNGIFLRKSGQLMGALLCVLFCPEDLLILSDGPSRRRRFLDIAISQLNPLYYYNLQQYTKLTAQKNVQLKQIKKNPKQKDVLFVWNEQIAEYGSKIIAERIKFIDVLKDLANESHAYISEYKEQLVLEYENTIELNEYDERHIKETYIKTLEKIMQREIEREVSLIGPHRDDISFRLNDLELKKYGSQGQKRTAVLSLKIAEIEIMKKNTGRIPILLLDDVMSELDKKRQEALLSYVKGVQTFITCVDSESFDQLKDTQNYIYNISDGAVSKL
jgi:DNA replication and repair protein RecF